MKYINKESKYSTLTKPNYIVSRSHSIMNPVTAELEQTTGQDRFLRWKRNGIRVGNYERIQDYVPTLHGQLDSSEIGEIRTMR
jgi:hypothetical protein